MPLNRFHESARLGPGLWSEDTYGPALADSVSEAGQRVDLGMACPPNFRDTPDMLRGHAALELVLLYKQDRPREIEVGLTPERADLHVAYIEANMPERGRSAIIALKKYAALARLWEDGVPEDRAAEMALSVKMGAAA